MDTMMIICGSWKFHLGECEEAWYKGHDDSGWRTVTLPHDWSVEQPFSREYSSGTGYLCGGIGWYRMHFTLPEEFRGKCVKIAFDGIYKNSQAWCNSSYLGKRPSGYASFSYDITPFVHFGERENVISVKAVHTDLSDSRWFTGSGITRKAAVMVEEPVHPQEYGIFFQTLRTDGRQAEIEIEHGIVNASGENVQVGVRTVLLDRKQNCVLKIKGHVTIGAGEEKGLVMNGSVAAPDLWSIKNPALYLMKTFYRVNGQEEYEVHQEMVGIRTFYFDPDHGFFLNQEAMKIKGVCVHHDGGCLGAAMKKEVWARRLEILKECGCNAIRCSHNPHMPQLYELCDRMGFLVIDEAFDEWENPKNKWHAGHNVYPPKHQGYYEDFLQWHEEDLKAMVRRDRNHPSVILWSIGNEIDYPNDPYCHPMFQTMTGNNDADKPEAERRYDSDRPNAERIPILAARLASIVSREDSTRPVTQAAAFPELTSCLGLLECLDVVGYNYKEHLYEQDHKRFPDKPFFGSENGHSYEAWLAVRDNPYISGQFLWTGIDYLGEAKGWPDRGSHAGLLTCAGFKKTEFYRRKSFWDESFMIHIGTKTEGLKEKHSVLDLWNYEPGEPIIVHCYSNLPEVALYLNEVEIGRRTNRFADGSYRFHVPYEEGRLKAVGLDSEGKECAEEVLETTKAAAKISCNVWDAGEAQAASLESGYLYQLEINLLDEAGRKTIWDERCIEVTVTGAGTLAGLENGNLTDLTPYRETARSTYRGDLIAYIRRTASGSIKVTLKTDIQENWEYAIVL